MKTISQSLIFTAVLALSSGVNVTQAADIYVHYDTGWGNHMSLRGSGGGLNWSQGVGATWTAGNIWHVSTPSSGGGFEFKPLLNDQSWSVGANYSVPSATSTVHIWPYFGLNGNSLVQFNFYSNTLGNVRTIRVLLPPSYHENELKSYPVLYIHDGQNLFSAATASFGVEWQVDETALSLMYQGKMREAIIVGMDNTGATRISEYTPTVDAGYGGGNGDAYLDFIDDELRPYIESAYRVKTGKENTMMMGSSLGGLISFYAGWTRDDRYGKVAGMSSSFWWDNQQLVGDVNGHAGVTPMVDFYIDMGGNEGSVAATQNMNHALLGQGYSQGQNLYYYFDANGSHTESSWRNRLHIPLQYLLPWKND